MPKQDYRQKTARRPKPQTLADYGRRYGQLKREAAESLPTFTADAFVAWIIGTKRKSWCASSWRVNRASFLYGFGQERLADPALGPAIDAAIACLGETRAEPQKNGTLRTSQQKAKRLPADDFDRIRHAALASRAPSRQRLVDFLMASRTAGLRPVEWPSARLTPSPQPGFSWQLIVRNGKYDEERDDEARAHGEFRTLRWVAMDEEIVLAITRWIAVARQAEQDGTYATLIRTLRDFMRQLTKTLFPRRRQRPTLYSGRHEAIARWKAHYVDTQTTIEGRLHGLAIVAALSGHASDETATRHYGRLRRGERDLASLPIPIADEAEVKRVRQRMQLSLDRLAERKAQPYSNRP